MYDFLDKVLESLKTPYRSGEEIMNQLTQIANLTGILIKGKNELKTHDYFKTQ